MNSPPSLPLPSSTTAAAATTTVPPLLPVFEAEGCGMLQCFWGVLHQARGGLLVCFAKCLHNRTMRLCSQPIGWP
jgi:hypothetical protein